MLGGSIVLCALFPALLNAQNWGREALSSFPEDTEQLIYTNLAALRCLPEYHQIKQHMMGGQLHSFEEFLRAMGTDPDKDVDELLLGWRGDRLQTAGFFGLAQGRFQPGRIQGSFAKHGLPIREYAGQDFYVFGSGADPADLFFTFFDSSLAAFGRQTDLKAILDTRARTRPALASRSDFVNQEAELEASSPQWGIASRKALATRGKSWLRATLPTGSDALLAIAEGAIYTIDWANNLLGLSLFCRDREAAQALAKILTLWRDSQTSAAGGPSHGSPPLGSELNVQTSGSRVELSASASIETLQSLIH